MDIRTRQLLDQMAQRSKHNDPPIYLGSIGDIGTHLSNSFDIADKHCIQDNDQMAVDERFHCLNCLNSSIEDKEDNGDRKSTRLNSSH